MRVDVRYVDVSSIFVKVNKCLAIANSVNGRFDKQKMKREERRMHLRRKCAIHGRDKNEATMRSNAEKYVFAKYRYILQKGSDKENRRALENKSREQRRYRRRILFGESSKKEAKKSGQEDLSDIIDLDQYSTTSEEAEQKNPSSKEEVDKEPTLSCSSRQPEAGQRRITQTPDEESPEEQESQGSPNIPEEQKKEVEESPLQSIVPLGQRIMENEPWLQQILFKKIDVQKVEKEYQQMLIECEQRREQYERREHQLLIKQRRLILLRRYLEQHPPLEDQDDNEWERRFHRICA